MECQPTSGGPGDGRFHAHLRELFRLGLSGGSDFTGINFSGAVLDGATLDQCNLTRADFTNCHLKQASLKNAIHVGTIFSKANLTGAKFGGVLTNVTGPGATLDEADFTDVTLIGVSLGG